MIYTISSFWLKYIALFFFFGLSNCQPEISYSFQEDHEKIKGITIAAPPNAFVDNPLKKIQDINADWVCLVPYGFTRPGSTDVIFNMERQWWGEKKEGIIESIKQAKENNLKTLLKPQIYIPGNWVGDLTFESDAKWKEWEANYRDFILFFAQIAEANGAEMFCIATEFKKAVQTRPSYWKELIKEIRSIYKGELIYSANWDGYEACPIWSEVDYIGISAYFPLSEEKTPSVSSLQKAWEPTKKKLKKFASKHQKQIIFTEYGYQSVDGCAGKAWLIEKARPNLAINQQAQANALEAILTSFKDENWWHGSFLWKWFPNMQGHEGYPEKDYTPQDKIAEGVLKKINASF